MTCNLNQEELLEYLDNEAPDNRWMAVETHLGACAECRAMLAGLKKTDALWKSALHPHALAPSFPDSIGERLTRATPDRRVFRWATIASVAACLALVVWAAIRHYSTDYPVPTPADTAGNEVVGSIDKPPVVITGSDQAPVKPLSPTIAYQGEKEHFHALHKKNIMLSVFIRTAKRNNICDTDETKEAVQELVRLMQDPDDEIRGIAAAALGQLKAADSIPELMKLLQDKYAGARGWAAIALAELGAFDKMTDGVLADIELIRDNSDEACQTRAREALNALRKE
jgi:hypothetical protein